MHVKTYAKSVLQDTLKHFNQAYVISCILWLTCRENAGKCAKN